MGSSDGKGHGLWRRGLKAGSTTPTFGLNGGDGRIDDCIDGDSAVSVVVRMRESKLGHDLIGHAVRALLKL
jgi:hypothetical protein